MIFMDDPGSKTIRIWAPKPEAFASAAISLSWPGELKGCRVETLRLYVDYTPEVFTVRPWKMPVGRRLFSYLVSVIFKLRALLNFRVVIKLGWTKVISKWPFLLPLLGHIPSSQKGRLLRICERKLLQTSRLDLGFTTSFFWEIIKFGFLGSQVTSLHAYCNSDEIMDETKWAPLNEKDLLSTWVTGKRRYAVGAFKNVKISRFPKILPCGMYQYIQNEMLQTFAMLHDIALLIGIVVFRLSLITSYTVHGFSKSGVHQMTFLSWSVYFPRKIPTSSPGDCLEATLGANSTNNAVAMQWHNQNHHVHN